MKKCKMFLSVMLVVALLIPGTSAFAATKQNITNCGTYVIITNNNTGSKFKIPFNELGQESQTVSNNIAGTDITKTFEFNINKNAIDATEESQLKEKWDNSISVHGYLKLIYKEQSNTGGGGNQVILTNVNGKWEKDDNSVSMSDREVYYACVDGANSSQYTLKYPTGNRFSYNTGFRHSVNDSTGNSACGAKMWVTLHHGSSSNWTFEVNNTLFSNGEFPIDGR